MPRRLPLVTALAFAVVRVEATSRSCLTNTGTSAAGCDCTGTGGASTCASNACICTGGGCAGSDNKCYMQQNTQVGGGGQIYRIRNARWPDWYLESESSAARLWVGKGRDTSAARTYQWTLHALPTAATATTYMLFTEFRTNHAMTYGTQRVCSVVVNGTELELNDTSTGPGDALANDAPGPDGFPVAGQGMNGEDLALEPIVENETARQLELAERSPEDPDGDWFEGDDENEADEEAKEMSQMVRREEMSYRSRFGSYYSRSRFSSYYSRSRYTSYYSRSRTYYSRSRTYSYYGSYGSYYSAYSYYNSYRRRVYCRNVLVGNAASVTSNPKKSAVTMKLQQAPVSSNNAAAPLFMLSAAAYPNNYLWVPRFSSTVDINSGDPGAGGYWFFDPPLPNSEVARIPAYSGAKCRWSCGSVGTINDVGAAFVNKASKQTAPLLLHLLSLAALAAGASWAHA